MEGHSGDDPLDYEGAESVLAGRGARADCPVCGVNSWGAPGELSNLLVHIDVQTLHGDFVRNGAFSSGVSAFTWICRNCGFIRLHHRHVIQNPPPDDLPETP